MTLFFLVVQPLPMTDVSEDALTPPIPAIQLLAFVDVIGHVKAVALSAEFVPTAPTADTFR